MPCYCSGWLRWPGVAIWRRVVETWGWWGHRRLLHVASVVASTLCRRRLDRNCWTLSDSTPLPIGRPTDCRLGDRWVKSYDRECRLVWSELTDLIADSWKNLMILCLLFLHITLCIQAVRLSWVHKKHTTNRTFLIMWMDTSAAYHTWVWLAIDRSCTVYTLYL